MSMVGRVALVTGAAQGIGRAIAEGLSCSGASIVVADIQEEMGQRVVDQLRLKGGKAEFVRTDLCRAGDIKHAVEYASRTYGGLDILINNARPNLARVRFPESLNSWDLAMDVLLKAPAIAIGYALPHLVRSGKGSVVNVASTNAYHISQQPVTYHVAKAGIVHLTRSLAYELGHQGLRVNAICPGLLDISDRSQKLTDDPKNRKIVNSIVPLKRAGTAEEVARVAVFLCSPAAAYITGQALVVDGGMILGDQFSCAMQVLEDFKSSSSY